MYTLSQRTSNILLGLAALIIFGTWLILVIMQPSDADWSSPTSSQGATIALVGYLAGSILAIIAMLPRLSPQLLGLIPIAIVLNVVLGQLVGTGVIPIPLYFDSLGTILVGVLGGPGAGMLTGALSGLVWGTFNPTVIPFSAAYAMTGLLSGFAAPYVKSALWKAMLCGAGVGVVSALLCTPVASFIFGGTAGTGTGWLVTVFKALGFDTMTAVLLQSMSSDPIDKIILFTVVYFIVRALPQRTLRLFAEKPAELTSAQNASTEGSSAAG